MKLLRELNEAIETSHVQLDEGDKKSCFIEGIFLQGNLINGNKRYYPSSVLEESVQAYNQNFISKNRSFGELGHPSQPHINLERVSHIIKSLVREGNNYIGKAKIMTDSPYGKIVHSLINEGAKLGVSSRGLGVLTESKQEGRDILRVDAFRITTAADIVADPSAPDCFVDSLMENQEWIMDTRGIWKTQDLEEAQKQINQAPSRKLQEEKIKIWQKFLENL